MKGRFFSVLNKILALEGVEAFGGVRRRGIGASQAPGGVPCLRKESQYTHPASDPELNGTQQKQHEVTPVIKMTDVNIPFQILLLSELQEFLVCECTCTCVEHHTCVCMCEHIYIRMCVYIYIIHTHGI